MGAKVTSVLLIDAAPCYLFFHRLKIHSPNQSINRCSVCKHDKRISSVRSRNVLTEDDVAVVNDLILNQEDEPDSH